MCVHAIEHCLSGLRTIVYTKTNDSLKVHKKYIAAIHAEQIITSTLEIENAKLEERIFGISRLLRATIGASTAIRFEDMRQGQHQNRMTKEEKEKEKYLNPDQGNSREDEEEFLFSAVELEKSPDYVLGLIQTLADGLNQKYTF